MKLNICLQNKVAKRSIVVAKNIAYERLYWKTKSKKDENKLLKL